MGLSSPAGARPSTVVISAPSACTANMRQERTASPFMMTVHAPQTPCSHPRWVPVSTQSSRRKSASVLRVSTVAWCAVPLTVNEIVRSGMVGLVEGSGEAAFDEVPADGAAVRAGCVHVVGGFPVSYTHLRAHETRHD